MLPISRTWIIVVLLVALVAVCIGSVSVASAFYERALVATLPVTPSISGAGKDAKLTLVGDSRVTQWASNDGLDARYLGFSGATSNQVELYLSRSSERGGVVAIQVGVNDLRVLGIRPEFSAEIVSMVTTSIQRVVNILSDRYEAVIVLGIFPVDDPELLRKPVWSNAVGTAIDLVNRNLADLTYPANSKFVPTELVFQRLGKQAFRDTLHVTDRAYFDLNALLQESISNAL